MPDQSPPANAELNRLDEDAKRTANWQRWGPYLSERQWGTVREDYSSDGDCWNYLTHDQSRSRAYRWGEDGILGICDREGRLHFAVALWNGRDPILKERLFGLTGPEGNHGEDVKELYYFLESTPTHSYMKGLYKYPQAEFPYAQLVETNRNRGRHDREFEITDTGVFDGGKYFDVAVEYAKASSNDILIRLTITNHAADAASLYLLPTLWFRNTWSWGCTHEGCEVKPWLRADGPTAVVTNHATLEPFRFEVEPIAGQSAPGMVFTENESNNEKLFGTKSASAFVKDAFHTFLIENKADAVNPTQFGTKMAAVYPLAVPAGGTITVRMRLYSVQGKPAESFGKSFDALFAQRVAECDAFYADRLSPQLNPQERNVARQAYAGLLWSKQFYHYVIANWLDGDPDQPSPPPGHKNGRNHDWRQLFSRDVLSMPDSWEYPWFAIWDLAFHMVCFARIDPVFAKKQLILLMREWYMHPSGKLPAYEFSFDDTNPPVHAWACWRAYKITGKKGQRDRLFLERAFQKLLINFTWWVNRKDIDGKNIFGGGFLGLDNIGVFDRSKPLPNGASLQQADGTAWMAFYCGTMLSMALELAPANKAYEDIASKFFEHYISIVDAMNHLGGTGLWNEQDGFYYDQLHINDVVQPLRTRSLVGVIPLIACEVLDRETLEKLPGFNKRMRWFLEHRSDLAKNITFMHASADAPHATQIDGAAADPKTDNCDGHYLLAVPTKDRLVRVLKYVLDESEFLSPFGLRSVSRYHKDHPFCTQFDGQNVSVDYEPGESQSGLFGGNSNWRGPVWFPINYLLIEALERYYHFYGDDLKVECPVGSGAMLTLMEVSRELSARMSRLFLPDATGQRPCHAEDRRYADDPAFKDLVLFYEHFHGDNGRGIGASHQTGWTALVTRCLENVAWWREAGHV